MSDFRTQVVEELVRHIEAGTAPWQKPWEPDIFRSAPFNPTSGKNYRGMNAWWLELRGYDDPRWMTYRQAMAAGGQVRKGEKGTLIEYWKWSDRVAMVDGDGKPLLNADGQQLHQEVRLERPKVFHAVVFNGHQVDGLEPYKAPAPSFSPIERAERVLGTGGVPILHDRIDRAFYSPLEDKIHLPAQAAFKGAYEYYATALHELGHATGHASRLGRDFGPFGSEAYAKEELRAEMASFMVATELGLGHYPERHASYVGSWLKALKDDRNLLFVAARDAEIIRTWVMEPEKRQELSMGRGEEKAQVQVTRPDMAPAMGRTAGMESAAPAAERDKLEEPSLVDRLENYFRPGRMLPSYGGGEDRILEFRRKGPFVGWEVLVEGVTNYGEVEKPRTHCTAPSERVLAEWEKENPIPAEKRRKRAFLDVPFAEKDQAKAAGAKWDKEAKAWYIPPDADPQGFARWQVERQPAAAKAPERQAFEETQAKAGERRPLYVPYAEKDQAKAAGAKWDRQAKTWYAPEGVDPQPFQRWMAERRPAPADERSAEGEFADALRKHGLILKDSPVMDGKWHRVAVEGDKAGQLSGSYRGFLEGRPAGQIMNYRAGEKAVQWVATGNQVDPAELAQLRVDADKRKAQQQQDLQAQYQKVAKRAYGIFVNASPAPDTHPYLQRKGVRAGELRIDGEGNLLVPMRDERGYLWNLQLIQPDGTKRYLPESRKAGLMHVMKGDGKGPTIIAEGYATAADLHEASGRTVVMAFDAGNLGHVATTLKKLSPDLDLVIAADDDHKLEAEGKANTGIVRARQAAQAVNGRAIVPPLLPGEKLKGLSDYNDLKQERGPKALAGVLAEQLGTAKAKEKKVSREQRPAQMAV